MWLLTGSLVSELGISEDTYKALSLKELELLLNEFLLPELGINETAVINDGVLSVGGLFKCKPVVVREDTEIPDYLDED